MPDIQAILERLRNQGGGWAASWMWGSRTLQARTQQVLAGAPFKRLSGGAGILQGMMQRPSRFTLPGAGAGRVLTGQAALSAAQSAFAQGQQQFGGLMKLMGREAANPADLLGAFQASIGAGKGTAIWQQTELGGMLGLRLGGQDIMLPTAHGPFMLTPSRDAAGGVSMKVTGVKGRLELSNVIASEAFEVDKLRQATIKEIRGVINEQMATLRGGRSDPGIMWPARGGQLDFLKMNRGFVEEVSEVLAKNQFVTIGQAMRAVSETQKLGYHPLFGKPEAMLNAIMPLMGDPTRIFPQIAARGRPLYQDTAFAGLFPQDVSAFEKGVFGRSMPKIRTRAAATVQRALSPGLEQGVTTRIGLLDPSHSLFGRLAGQTTSTGGRMVAPGVEQVVISQSLAQNLRFIDESGGKLRKVGVGTPLKVGGHSVIIGGVADDATMAGQHLLFAAKNFEKHPDRYLQLLYGEALHDALSTGRGSITVDDIGTFAHSGAVVAGTPRQIVFTPSDKLSAMGMGEVTKKVSKALGININAARSGGMLSVIGEIGVRGGMQYEPSFGPAKAKTLDFMTMALGGEHARTIAHRQMARARVAGGSRAQAFFGFFGMFQGRNLPSSAFAKEFLGRKGWGERFRALAPGKVDSQLIAGLQNVRRVSDLHRLVNEGLIPDYDIALNLPKNINVPMLGGGGTVRTNQIPLPTVRTLPDMLKRLTSGLGHLPEDVAQEIMEETRAFLPRYVAGVGRVLQAAADFGLSQNVDTEQALQAALHAGVKGEFEGLLPLLARHTGGRRLISQALQPPLPGSQAVYGRIVQGMGRGGGITGLPEVGLGEVGISESMAERLGISRKRIQSIKGGFDDLFVGQQYWPSIVPETQAVKKVRILTNQELRGLGAGAHDLISTNLIDRLAAFRDVDYDPTRLFTFRGQTQKELRLAWKEHQNRLVQLEGRIQQFWNAHGAVGEAKTGGVFAAALGVGDDEIRSLLAQKVLAPRHHTMMRRLQAMMERQAGMGVDVADAARTLGSIYQIGGIKKGVAGEQGTRFFNLLEAISNVGPGGDLGPTIEKVATAIGDIGPDAAFSDVFLGLPRDSVARKAATQSQAQILVNAAAQLKDPAVREALDLMRLTTGAALGADDLAPLLGAVEGRVAPAEAFGPSHLTAMMGLGARDPAKITVAAAQSIENAATKEAGAAAKAEGGIARKLWASTPGWGKALIAGAGLLTGARIIKSTLAGDEPAEPMPSGSPLPPGPIGLGGGYHDSLSGQQMAPFRPPTARIISPMQRSPSVTMTATAPKGMSFQALGDRLVAAANSPAGMPLAGVFSSGISDPSRIDMNIAEEMRAQNRLYM